MKRVERIPAEHEPFRIGISFTMRGDGSGVYMIETMANTGVAPKSESWGFAYPSCGHLKCRWANLAWAAMDWAELIVPAQGVAAIHPETLGLEHPRQ